VTAAGEWLGRGALAARLTADRPTLWVSGAVGALAYAGWLPIALVVGSAPKTSDFAFLGADLYTSPLFPFNVLFLAFLFSLAVVIACTLAALGEAVLLRQLGEAPAGRPLGREVGMLLSVIVVAALPVAVAVGAAALGLASIAPAAFTSPDIGGPLLVRLAGQLALYLIALAAALLVGQAWGACAMRRAVADPPPSLWAALIGGLRDVVGRPGRRIGLALLGTFADLIAILLAVAVLRILWSPIEGRLASGSPLDLAALPLLLGFVTIWLVLVLVAGSLHTWVSTWWSLELSTARIDAPVQGEEVAR
jgi:hypothetical protein